MTAPYRRATGRAARRLTVAGAAVAACLAAPSTAASAATPRPAPQPPLELPGDARTASVPADGRTWIVGARPGPAARAVARRFGARPAGPRGTGGYVVPRPRARALAGALRRRGLLVYAQANTLGERLQVGSDPLSVPPNAWRDQVVERTLAPPLITADSPLIALVDSALDPSHPEFVNSLTSTLPGMPVTDSHGTATASVAAAPVNGVGIVGVWPGARAANIPLPATIRCSDSAERIASAIEQGAAVINMSYGSQGLCYPEYVALQFAVARGIIPVAAAGNEFASGNPLEYPASLPHVLTVAAVGPDLQSSYFSNTSAAIDLSAPGEGIMTAVPPKFDGDGTRDGYERQSGTSFAAPMVAAAAAWVRQARPTLTSDQVAQVVRIGTSDLGRPGWEVDTGFGLLSVGSALTVDPPPRDPAEPNDDIMWVDGRAFRAPDRPIYKGRRQARRFALLDVFEDPADVYRIRVRRHSRVRVSANPSGRDDVALSAYRGGAKRIDSRPLKRSARRGRRTERLTIRNTSRRMRTFYIAVRVQRGIRDLDAGYALRVG